MSVKRVTRERRASPADHVVRLVRVAISNESRPTFARWKSFNARVLREWNPEDSSPTDNELLAELARKDGGAACPS